MSRLVAKLVLAMFLLPSAAALYCAVFFLLEEELLEPVYAIYDRWSPEIPGNLAPAEREEFNRALFSLTAFSESGAKALPVDFTSPQAVVDEWGMDDGPAEPRKVLPAQAGEQRNRCECIFVRHGDSPRLAGNRIPDVGVFYV